MLNIYFKGEDNKIDKDLELVTDAELEFNKIGIPNTDIARTLIKKIEQGEYFDDFSFIDRFGNKLDMEYMSTGCKAALVVSANPDKLIDLRECGWNARDEIIKNCKEGNILIEHNDITFGYTREEENKEIDVRLDNYRFTSISSLNRYVKERDYNEETGRYFLNEESLYEGMEVVL